MNALSERFYVESFRDGESSWATYERGELKDSGKKEKVSEKNGTLVVFTPDSEMFGAYEFHMDIVETMVKNYSYLKKGLSLVLNGTAYTCIRIDVIDISLVDSSLRALCHACSACYTIGFRNLVSHNSL